MPLKPMFSRAPLTRQPLAPLAPEHIRLEGSAAETLERLCALAASTSMNAELAEGALTCAYLQHNEELAANTEKWLWTQLAEQREDGGLPGDTETNLRSHAGGGSAVRPYGRKGSAGADDALLRLPAQASGTRCVWTAALWHRPQT